LLGWGYTYNGSDDWLCPDHLTSEEDVNVVTYRVGGTPDPAAKPVKSDTVAEVIDGRVNVYGEPTEVFWRHAEAWSAILGTEVRPDQVALCLIAYKAVRASVTPDYSDNSDDIEGYLDIFRKIVDHEMGMIHARNTEDYVAKGGRGAR